MTGTGTDALIAGSTAIIMAASIGGLIATAMAGSTDVIGRIAGPLPGVIVIGTAGWTAAGIVTATDA
ncbi:MAG: hypothetical protein Pars92KO_30410 [Parasphingorhabdus sp.]